MPSGISRASRLMVALRIRMHPWETRVGSNGISERLVHGVLSPNAAAAYPAYGGDTMWCPSPEGWSQRCAAGFSFVHMPGY